MLHQQPIRSYAKLNVIKLTTVKEAHILQV